MFADVSGSLPTVRVSVLKGFGLGTVVAALVALVAVATLRETAAPKQEAAKASSVFEPAGRPAMTAAEEAYAHALWPIHAQVKQNAVRMTFAGLAYKMGDIGLATVKKRVAPLKLRFDAALEQAHGLRPPESMLALHGDYVDAIRLYRDSTVTMIQAARDGRDEHLTLAHEMSVKAAGLTLKVGETLWPGEFKPN
ncbi:MAG: hypothetical protein ACT4PQ_13255 [Betaproteobacteria bacterium]